MGVRNRLLRQARRGRPSSATTPVSAELVVLPVVLRRTARDDAIPGQVG